VPFLFITCTKCQSRRALLASQWANQKSYFCPDCEHRWDVDAERGEPEPAATQAAGSFASSPQTSRTVAAHALDLSRLRHSD
jgi:uncharacterized protein YlaI